MNDTVRVLVLGGGYAGVLAALRIQGKLGASAEVTLVNRAAHFVERIRLHEVAASGLAARRALTDLTAGTGVRVCIGTVESLDLDGRQAQVRVEGGVERLAFDTLVYAAGSRAAPSGVPGAGAHAASVSDEDAALRLHAALAALPDGGEVAVIGGGLTALELAAEIAERRPELRVQLVSRGRVAAGFSDGARASVRDALAELGVSLSEGQAVQSVEPERVWLADGTVLPSRVTVWAGGFVPNPIARGAGLETNAAGQLLVDSTLRSLSHPFVFGAGDGMAIAADDAAHVRMGCVTAMPLAAHAADNVVRLHRGRALRPFGFSFFIQCLSLGRRRGLIQFVRADDSPRGAFLSGAPAAWVKERICRFTVDTLRWERRWPGAYRWPGQGVPLGGRAGRLLPSPSDARS